MWMLLAIPVGISLYSKYTRGTFNPLAPAVVTPPVQPATPAPPVQPPTPFVPGVLPSPATSLVPGVNVLVDTTNAGIDPAVKEVLRLAALSLGSTTLRAIVSAPFPGSPSPQPGFVFVTLLDATFSSSGLGVPLSALTLSAPGMNRPATIVPVGFTSTVSRSSTPPTLAVNPPTGMTATYKADALTVVGAGAVTEAGPVDVGTLVASVSTDISTPTSSSGTFGTLPVVWIAPDGETMAVQFGIISTIPGVDAGEVMFVRREN